MHLGAYRSAIASDGQRHRMSSLSRPAPLTSSVVPEQPALQLDLPDPERDDISTLEFLAQLEQAWAVCDRFDLQTEIWRGRILRAVRDREKRGGEGRGAGFRVLREREISKTRAYSLIQLAESADDLVGGGMLEEGSVNQFSKRLPRDGPGSSGSAGDDLRGRQRGSGDHPQAGATFDG